MSDLKKLFKIIWKRFSLWIGLLALVTFLINGLNSSNELNSKAKIIDKSVNSMAEKINISAPSSGEKINQAYLDKAEEIKKSYAKKYKIKTQEDSQLDTYYDYENPDLMDQYDFDVFTPLYDYENGTTITSKEGISSYFKRKLVGPVLLFVIGISFFITSLEQSLAYSEFTSMFPWKKQDEVWMKALLVFLLGLGVLLVNFLLSFFVLQSSAFSQLIDMSLVAATIFKIILVILATSIFSVSTGMIAGNFLGHLGLLIIGAGGIDLIVQNIRCIISVFSTYSPSWFDKSYYSFTRKLPEFFKPFLTLTNIELNYINLVSYLIIAILIGILAYLVNQKVSSERSGYMVISRPIEKYTKILAIFSFAAIFFIILSDTLVNNENIFINIIVYGLGLLIGSKVFDILFKIRLKF